jgi:hypothetical protein
MISLVGLVARLQRGHIVTPRPVEPRRYPYTWATNREPESRLIVHPRHVPQLPRRNQESYDD